MSPLLACPDIEQLIAFAHGKSAEAEAQAVAQHLKRCGVCSARVKDFTPERPNTTELNRKDRSSATKPLVVEAPQTRAPATPAAAGAASFLRPPLEPDEIGRLGTYRVLRFLGRGGMGTVYQGEDLTLRRPVAIKILKQELEDQWDPWERFQREARTLAAIKHKHVVTVYHSGQEGRTAYLVMELLQGQSLADYLATVDELPLSEILRLGREITAGLMVVHQHGLVHRDIKPANIWLEAPNSHVKLLDFGLARLIKDDAYLTKTGVVVGTPAYMSPEQARGLEVDARSDLFSLGCILYRLCAGTEPFEAPNTMGVLTSLAVDEPPPIAKRNPRIPTELADLIRHLLAKNPEDRPATAKEVLERLTQLASARSPAASPPKRPALAASAKRPAPAAPPPHQTEKIRKRTKKLSKLVRTKKTSRISGRKWPRTRLAILLGIGALLGVLAGGLALKAIAQSIPQVKTAKKAADPHLLVEEPNPTIEPPPVVMKTKSGTAGVEREVKAPPVPVQPAKVEVSEKQPRVLEEDHPRPLKEYLSEWQPIGAVGWPNDPPDRGPFPPGNRPKPPPPPGGPKDQPPGGGAFSSPFPFLSVNDKQLAHGIGMHGCPAGTISLSYALRKHYDVFSSQVSLNDTSERSPLPLTFTVYGDGRRLWRSSAVITRHQVQTCMVSVTDVDVLVLTVTNTPAKPEALKGAHAVWVDPYVMQRK